MSNHYDPKTFTLSGLSKPNGFVGAFCPDDIEMMKQTNTVEGYYYDGNFYLMPMDAAKKFFNAAVEMAKDPETQQQMKEYDESAFVALWDVGQTKPGYAIIIHGICGDDETLLNPILNEKYGPKKLGIDHLSKGKDFFHVNDAHLAWPKFATDKIDDIDWDMQQKKDFAGDFFSCLVSITQDAVDKNKAVYNSQDFFKRYPVINKRPIDVCEDEIAVDQKYVTNSGRTETFEHGTFSIFTINPGTPLYAEITPDGRISLFQEKAGALCIKDSAHASVDFEWADISNKPKPASKKSFNP